jgi:hypothetical protein
MPSCTLDPTTHDGVKSSSIDNRLFERNAQLQRFTINSAEDTTIAGQRGTLISFKADSSTSTIGRDIEIDLCEYYSIGQCLLSGLSTTSNNRILETSGMIRLEARSSDASLPASDLRFHVSMPTRSGRDVSIFSGRTDSTGRIDWTLDQSTTIHTDLGSSLLGADTITIEQRPVFNTFLTSNLGWINCDRFVEYENLSDVLVSFKDYPPGAVYSLVLLDQASIIAGRATDGTLRFGGVPSGLNACVVALSMDDGGAMSVSMLDLTIGQGKHEMPELRPMPKEDIERMFEEKFRQPL